jgi:hydrogenase nickel incorporation protein HypB
MMRFMGSETRVLEGNAAMPPSTHDIRTCRHTASLYGIYRNMDENIKSPGPFEPPMHHVEIGVGTDVLEANRKLADRNRLLLHDNGVKAIDVMGAIGSGKTLLIERIIDRLKEKNARAGVIAGDVTGDDDYKRFASHGVPVRNLNTGKECHLEAHQVGHQLEHMDLKGIDILFIENVGNLVCPADFPLGSEVRLIVISVTEGDDMVRKHPHIFAEAEVVAINKTDLADAVEVNPQVIVKDLHRVNPHAKAVLTNAKSGEGVDELMDALGL